MFRHFWFLRPRTKVRNLLDRGVHPNWAKALGNSRHVSRVGRGNVASRGKGAWRISTQSPLHQALPQRYFTQTLGLSLLG